VTSTPRPAPRFENVDVFSALFVDTSAFYALEDADDRHHDEAVAIQEWCRESRPRLFTTHDVLDESITLLGVRLGTSRALRFGRQALTSRIIQVVRSDETLERAALSLYERFDDSRLSFTDCISFAVMRALEIPAAFAFDDDFRRAGFHRMSSRDVSA
jgi:uncharacterized protein